MSTYVMSDIHGCYDEFMALLKKIEFSDDDKMIIAGDYIDRGPDSDKMLDFICEHSDDPRFIFLKGNHDMEFVGYVDLIMRIVSKDEDGSILEDKEYAKDIYKRSYTTYVRELGFLYRVTFAQVNC